MSAPAVRFEGISKRFPGARALDTVSFDIAAGSCHALCGENGAGKSTLGKILAGIHAPDAGRLVLFGRPVAFTGPQQALAAGVGMVHQELAFCETCRSPRISASVRSPPLAACWIGPPCGDAPNACWPPSMRRSTSVPGSAR
jgi:ABC-type cobalamin/Fe3+-siderophores transport system ATPase subunit